jgi:hypothetical protein
MALLTRARAWLGGSIFHVAYPVMKHVENSNRGDRQAKRLGKRGTDLDMLITQDGRIVNTHWPHPMLRDGFRDPYGRVDKDTPVHHLTWVEVSRLRAGRWPRRYRIRSIEQALKHCARLGIVAVLEPKGDPRFVKDWPWQHIRAVADDVGATVSVRALPQNADALPAARRAGFEAWEI